MNKMNVILVYKSGGDFSFPDVNLLCSKIKEQADVNIYCLTDIVTEITKLKIVTLLPMPYLWKGWWSKMNLFAPDLEQYRPFLFFDLDTAVLGDVSKAIISNDAKGSFIILRDFYHTTLPASGMMWIPDNSFKMEMIWRSWYSNAQDMMLRFRGDQDFINSVVQPDAFWQDITKGIYTFKPTMKIWLTELPEDATVVCFHGKPRIWDATSHVKWVYNYVYEK